jgi:hypothetical protein
VGLIVAECINFVLRVAFGLKFIHSFFAAEKSHGFSFKECVPSFKVIGCFAVISGIAHASQSIFGGFSLMHFVVGGVLFVISLGTILLLDKPIQRDVRYFFSSKKVD